MESQDVTARRSLPRDFSDALAELARIAEQAAAEPVEVQLARVARGKQERAAYMRREASRMTMAKYARHLASLSSHGPDRKPQARPRNTARGREHRPRGRATARAPDRPREPEADEPPPCACGCGKPSRPGSKYHDDKHGVLARVRKHRAHAVAIAIPVDLAEQAWDAAGGDGYVALDAALAIVARLETVPA
jgi:hypothetical protein